MNPGDNEAGKRTVESFLKTPLNAASPMLSPPWTTSAWSFLDSLSTWSLSPSSLFSGSPAALVEENRDCSNGFNQNPSFSSPMSNSMSVSDMTLPPRERDTRTNSVIFGAKDTELILDADSSRGKEPMEELSDEIIKLYEEENGNGILETVFSNPLTMYPRDYEANKNTGESSTQIVASSTKTELESDPKKLKRRKTNRDSAARLREKKKNEVANLENKVETLKNETNSLSNELIRLETIKDMMMNINKELQNQADIKKQWEAKIQMLKEKSACPLQSF